MSLKHTVNKSFSPIQLDVYYMFGMPVRPQRSGGLQTADSWVADNTDPNNYLFNAGSEKNNTTNNYQTFFRDYDPALGRMTGVDAMAGKYSSVTPYSYAFNDPVGLNDPSGADPYYLPRYQEDWGGGTIMDQGRIADPEAMARDWVPGRGDLWGRGGGGDWADFNPSGGPGGGGFGFNSAGKYGIGAGYSSGWSGTGSGINWTMASRSVFGMIRNVYNATDANGASYSTYVGGRLMSRVFSDTQQGRNIIGAAVASYWSKFGGYLNTDIAKYIGASNTLKRNDFFKWTVAFNPITVDYSVARNGPPFKFILNFTLGALNGEDYYPYVINNSLEPVFYLKENSDKDPKVYILNAGGKLYERVDFISTHKYTDQIFKVPDFGRVKVLSDGSVDLFLFGFGDFLISMKSVQVGKVRILRMVQKIRPS